MNFLYPLGFLGLIGVPVLIIIYIIKNKYMEQVISSTYLWTLSEKFLKRRLPINKLVGLISLILQIFAVIFISIAVAHPVIVLPNSAHDYLFIIDGSASMNFVEDGKTRFELAKDAVISEINGSANGSAYNVIFVGDTIQTYRDIESKQNAVDILGDIECSYSSAGVADALGRAQEVFDNNPSVKTYLYTDKSFEESKNVNIVKIGSAVENYALSDISYRYDGDNLIVEGNALSYESSKELTVNVYIDGGNQPAQSVKLNVEKLEPAEISIDCGNTSFRTLKVEIAENDALMLDNSIIFYNEQYENSFSVLLVSGQATFISNVLTSLGVVELEVMNPDEYLDSYGDMYDLCIYDNFTPENMPAKAAVWFFNPSASVAKSGFTVQDEVQPVIGESAQYSNSTASDVKKLLYPFGNSTLSSDVHIKKYKKCGFYHKFLTLMSVGDVPVIFTGTNEYGNREIVFAFDLHDSEYALTLDFILLSDNLLNYAFPKIIEQTAFVCGETLSINMLSNCDSVRVTYPSGKVSPPLYTTDSVYDVILTEVGTYTVTALLTDGTTRSFNLYSSFPAEESAPAATAEQFTLQGEAGNQKRNGVYDNLLIIFILLAVIFAADWAVYCYEQYQLR